MYKRRRLKSVLFIFILLMGSYIPQFVSAIENSFGESTSQDLELEKQREQEYKEQLTKWNDIDDEGDRTTDIFSGLDWEVPNLMEDDKEFNEEEEWKVESAVSESVKKDGKADVIIRLKEKPDIAKVSMSAREKVSHEERVKMVTNSLQKHANDTQKELEDFLEALEKKGMVENIEPLWIINGFTITVDETGLEELMNQELIEKITLDSIIELPEITTDSSQPRLPEWGLEKIRATNVWGEYGIRGEGIVIGIMDTGVDGGHEALAHNYRGRDGNHQYSWIDVSGQNYATPHDGNGHGTHVAGTAVGGGRGEPIGVAPEAEWIAAKIFTDGGSATVSGIHRAFEWFMAPGGDPSKAPHIVNNSWGNANTYNMEFYEDVQAWLAAGIVPLFAAGNEGPGAQTVGSPGSFPQSLTIGATDIHDQIASFSSRGPVFWIDEAGNQQRILKPNLTAPGHQIFSAWPEGVRGYGKYHTISGTSMATPHVAGAIALLLQANQDLSIQDIKDILIKTARHEPHMGSLPNDLYGEGIVNIYKAVTEVAFAGKLRGNVQTADQSDIPIKIEIPAQEISLEVTDGPFEFSVKEGNHTVLVSAFGYQPLQIEVVIKKGEATTVDWSLVPAIRYEVIGRVIDKETQDAIPYAYISLKGTPLNVRTDKFGNFQMTNIPEGTYELLVSGEGIKGAGRQIEITGNQELTLEVEKKEGTYSSHWMTANSSYHRNAVSSNAIDINELNPQWEYENGSKGQILFSSPTATEEFVVFTTDRGWVTTLDAITGEERWSVRLGATNRSTPTISDNTIFLSGGQDGTIYALNLENGNIRWSRSVGQPAVYESPLYKDGTLIVSSGLTNNASVHALNATDGKVLWSKQLGGSSYFGGAIGGDNVYVGSYENRTFRALKLSDGEEIWSRQLEQEGFASRPVYQEGTVYVQSTNFSSGSGSLLAIDGGTGEISWQIAGVGDSQGGSPIVYENIVITGSYAHPLLKAFDKRTGEEVWSNRTVGSALHNGAVSANGILFFSGASGIMQAIDIFSGTVLQDFTMPDYSTSGSLVLPGNVIVPHRNGLVSFQSPGTVEGNILDENGEPVEATISTLETDRVGEMISDSRYRFQHQPGDYTLKVSSYGKKQVLEHVTFVSGYKEERNFTLEEAEIGGLTISVKDKRTSQSLSDVEVTIKDTPLKDNTDNDGRVAFDEVFEGSYEVVFTLNGYKEWSEMITIEPKAIFALEVNLMPIDIAVLNDWEGEITALLNANGFLAEERDWGIVNDISRYKIVYLNGAYGSGGWKPNEALFLELVANAKEHNVHLVFTDSWGSNYGSIHHLNDFQQDPKEMAHFNGSGQVRLQVDEEHPILNGFTKGDRVTLFTRTGDFAWFNQYSGRHLASIGSTTQGMRGTGISYKAVSENSAHLLLANHGGSPWISPLQGWLPEMQTILFNGLDFLMETDFGKMIGTVVDLDGNPVQAEIGIVETNVTSKTKGERAEFELFHDEGEYTIEIRANGFATQTERVVIEHGSPINLEIVLASANGDKISGIVTDGSSKQPIAEATVQMIKDNEIVMEKVTSANGRFEFTEMEYGSYTMQIEKSGYILVKQRIEVGRVQDEVMIELYSTPQVAVLKDYSVSGRNFQSLMGDAGIPVTSLTFANVVDQVKDYDVLFINEATSTELPLPLFNKLMEQADLAGTSVIFGENYSSNSGLARLVALRQDPDARRTILNTTRAAGYVVDEQHPLFRGEKVGEFLEMTLPTGGRVATFEGYSGYSLASLRHEGDDVIHGPGVAYKPRTANSVELLLGGHGFGTFRNKDHYTEQGKDFLVDAIVWAANVEYQSISGTITDGEGVPLSATISVEGEAFDTISDPETGAFSIAMLDGEYEITVESFGYTTVTRSVQVNSSSEPIELVMQVEESVGEIVGIVEDEESGNAIDGVKVEVLNAPRVAYTNTQGSFQLSRLMPGNYDLVFTKEGYVEKVENVVVEQSGRLEKNVKLKPSPTIGVIVDSTASGTIPLKQYLEGKGYHVTELNFTNTELLEDVDLVIANSDYDNSKIPTMAEFNYFVEALDRTKTSIIWTGQHGGRGSLRYMNDYHKNPGVVIGGSMAGVQGLVYEDHPIVDGVPINEAFPVTSGSNYYYAFDEYDGQTIAQISTSSGERIGEMIGYKGRTNQSLEVLLANFTFGHPFHPGAPQFFDSNRERILQNTITWILDNEESLVGEMEGTVVNDKDMKVQATVTVLETGKVITTDQQGQFYLGLPSGNYTIKVEAFGHHPREFSIEIENGDTKELSFEIQTAYSGVVNSTVKDSQTGMAIEDATVTILETPLSGRTDSEGRFEAVLPVGTYTVRVTAPGYAPMIQNNVVIQEKEVTEIEFFLAGSEKIAVIGTAVNGGRIMDLLEQRGYDSAFHMNNNLDALRETIAEYALIIFNDRHSSMTNEQFQSFVELADNNQVSIIFASQFSGGTIRDLSSVYNDPTSVSQSYESAQIQVKVEQDHPIFNGFTSDTITILRNGTSNQQYSVYQGYSGTTIGSLTHPEKGNLGDGIGYDYRTANSVHVLLSGLHAGTYGHPASRWTEEAKELYFNAIDFAISSSQGEVTGTVRSEDGEAIENAKVRIDSLGIETITNTSGQYKMGVGNGTYEIKVSARGYLDQVQTIEINELGEEVVADFVLEKIEGAIIRATITNTSDQAISGANVKLKALDSSGIMEEITTSENGIATFDDLQDGEYEITVTTNGYLEMTETVIIAGSDVELVMLMQRIEVAVIGDWNETLTDFLNEEGLYSEAKDWNVIDDINNYQLVVVNTKAGTDEQMENLLIKADEMEVSLVFTGTWGDGSIPLYAKQTGYPLLDQQGYNESSIKVKVEKDHPIFEGIVADDEGFIVIHGEKSPYSTFLGYPGDIIGNLYVNEEDKGASIAYEFKGQHHMHLLLSSFAVNNMIGPKRGWTEEGKQVYVQALRFAMDAEREEEPEPVEPPSSPEWGEKRIQTNDKPVTIKGQAEPFSIVHIYLEKGREKTRIDSVEARENGTFQAILDLKNGNNFLLAQAENEGGVSDWSETLQVIITGKPSKNDSESEQQRNRIEEKEEVE
ncbi:carboxypeptidase regulatory-like domain-containing protein [Sutcliffiella rhizosphaerae]|uniref:Outer membrane protein assembly factor BamB n=1 Tax=Sutcliffiella rhizosphaerae TaxID=2880967 RepID=A0ABN8AEB0_9BACI|nr:carboxypeptidase regulatory-like domain-containing protein [Sutcliffiella rhizosphaerae]CAG9622442.1 Outer membrane protein assembly factor BamB [Sutcliffiella rhizosphaerae]